MSLGNLATANLMLAINATTLPITGVTGAATTYTFTAATFCIGGKVYGKATAAGAATPTTEANGQSLAVADKTGTVIVWAVNAAGTISLYRGSTEAVDAAGAFLKAPEFPTLPDSVVAVAYTTLTNITGSAKTVGSSNWSTFTAANHQNVMFLPERPQLS